MSQDTDIARIARYMAVAYETSDRLVQGHSVHTPEQAVEHFESYMAEAAALYDAGLQPAEPSAPDLDEKAALRDSVADVASRIEAVDPDNRPPYGVMQSWAQTLRAALRGTE